MSLENLQALEGETKALDAEITTPPPDAPPDPDAPPPLDYNSESAQAVDMFAALLVGYAPKAADIWSTETKARVSAALAPVLQKYGITLGNLPPELTLIVMAGPPLYQSIRMVSDQIKADRAPTQDLPMPKVWPNLSNPPGEGGDNPAENNPHAPGTHPQVDLYK